MLPRGLELLMCTYPKKRPLTRTIREQALYHLDTLCKLPIETPEQKCISKMTRELLKDNPAYKHIQEL